MVRVRRVRQSGGDISNMTRVPRDRDIFHSLSGIVRREHSPAHCQDQGTNQRMSRLSSWVINNADTEGVRIIRLNTDTAHWWLQ